MSDLSDLLERGTDSIYPSKEFLQRKLEGSEKLKVYLGVDPTGELQLHHAIPLFKLRHFQKLGHKIYLLIGSFTATIGDPTGKTKARVPLTKEQVLANAKNYAEYASRVLDFENNPPEIVYNGDWLEQLTFKEVVELAAHFTVQQMLERDMFQERLKSNLPISLHEFMYPLMQGYDSVHLGVDVEVGGTDQTFNMLAGRKLIEAYSGKEKAVLSVPLLTDANGRKMSKSDGTGIPLSTTAEDMYGKIMSLPDSFIVNMFIQTTEVPLEEIKTIEKSLADGVNPITIKKQLALNIVSRFYGDYEGKAAEEAFLQVVQRNELPSDIPTWTIEPGLYDICELIFTVGLVDSKSDSKRMVQQQAVSVYENDVEKRITDPHTFVEVTNGMVIRVGKRRFVKLLV